MAQIPRVAPGEVNFGTVGLNGDDEVQLSDSAPPTSADPRCVLNEPLGYLECQRPARARLELGDGNDIYGFTSDHPADLPAEVDAGDGNDRVNGYAGYGAPAPQLIDGGPGDDEIFAWANVGEGDSTITGGAGNDKLRGHDHTETIDGGPGNDRVEGGMGNDGIDCGAGEDRVTADAIDVVAANCETVDQGAPGGGGKPGATKLRLRRLKRGLTYEHACTAACTLKVRAKLTRKARRRLGRLRTGTATLEVQIKDARATQRSATTLTLSR